MATTVNTVHFDPTFTAISNVQPFTYRDGETYLTILARLREYINDVIIPAFNGNVEELNTILETKLNEFEASLNEAQGNWQDLFDAFMDDVRATIVRPVIVEELTGPGEVRDYIESITVQPGELVWSVKDFGATGDGVTDDSPSIQAAFDYAHEFMIEHKSNGARIHFPAGTYLMNSRAVFTTDTGDPAVSHGGIHISGDGDNATVLLVGLENSDGALRIITKSSGNPNIHDNIISDLSILSQAPIDGAYTNGNAIQVDADLPPDTAGYGDHARWSLSLRHLFIGGHGSTLAEMKRHGNFMKGIHVEDQGFIKVEHVRIVGRHNEGVEALNLTRHTRNAWSHGIHLIRCYAPELNTAYVHGNLEHGFYIQGKAFVDASVKDFEGTGLVNCYFVNQDYGVTVSHDRSDLRPTTLYEPGMHIVSGHINSRIHCVRIIQHRQVVIDDVYFYCANEQVEPTEPLPTAILLDSASDVWIKAQFFNPGFFNSQDNASVAVRAENGCEAIVVDAIFGHGGIGLYNNTTFSNRQTIMANVKLDSSRRLPNNNAPLLPLVDKAGTASLHITRMGTTQDIQEMTTSKTAPDGRAASILRLGSRAQGRTGLSSIESFGVNDAGEYVQPTRIVSDMFDATAGLESGQISLRVIANGSTHAAFTISHPGSINASFGLLRWRDSLETYRSSRIEVGEPDSGGTGYRALRIAN